MELLKEFSPFPQLLRWNTQSPIEFTRRVLPGDRSSELDQFIIIEKLLQLRKQFVAYFSISDGHAVGILK